MSQAKPQLGGTAPKPQHENYYWKKAQARKAMEHKLPEFLSRIRAKEPIRRVIWDMGLPLNMAIRWRSDWIEGEMLDVPSVILDAIQNFRQVPRIVQKRLLKMHIEGASIETIRTHHEHSMNFLPHF